MAKQLFVNNFEWALASAVKGTPSSGSPEMELDYGVIRLAPAAEAFLPAPGGGDWYLMTLLARSGSVESGIEIVKVLGANEPTYTVGGEFRLRVLRGQEGTNPVPHAAGDLAAVRFTAAGAANMVQDTDDRLSDARPPTGLAGGVLAGNYPNPAFAEPMATSADLSAAVGTREASIASGTTSQYWRGDKTWKDFATDVRNAALAGLSTATNALVAASDTVLSAVGKLQAQISGHIGSGGSSHSTATGAAHGFMAAADKAKLDSIATDATKNATDAQLRDRSTHTGTQGIPSVTGLQSALDGKAPASHTHAQSDVTGLQSALDGKAANNVALTDAAGTPTLPSTAAAPVVSRLQVLRNNVKQAFADIAAKQDTLISGTNIKTVGGQSLLGTGDIPVGGGGGSTAYTWNSDGTLATATAGGVVSTYAWYADGRLNTISTPTQVATYNWNAGNPQQLDGVTVTGA